MTGVAAPPIARSSGAPSARARSERARVALAAGALVVLVAIAAAIALSAAGGRSFLVPASEHGLPAWMAGPLGGLAPTISQTQFTVLLAVMVAAWIVLLATGGDLGARWVIGAIVLCHLLFAIAPPLLSKDVFNYIGFARLQVLHGQNPFTVALDQFDSGYRYTEVIPPGDPYGPLFGAVTYPLALLSEPVAMWIVKLVTAAASLGLVRLVWSCAKRLGRDPLAAVVWVGLNPILLVYAVGGGHNDLLMLLLLTAAVALALDRREGAATISVIAAAAIKVSALVVLPFLLLDSRERRRVALAALAGAAVFVALSAAAFQGHALGMLTVLHRQQLAVLPGSLPAEAARLVGLRGVTSDVRLASRLAIVATVVWLAWRVWRRRTDWITASGVAMIVLASIATWLVEWYAIWSLPFAALSRSRWLRLAAVALVVYMVALRWPLKAP